MEETTAGNMLIQFAAITAIYVQFRGINEVWRRFLCFSACNTLQFMNTHMLKKKKKVFSLENRTRISMKYSVHSSCSCKTSPQCSVVGVDEGCNITYPAGTDGYRISKQSCRAYQVKHSQVHFTVLFTCIACKDIP